MFVATNGAVVITRERRRAGPGERITVPTTIPPATTDALVWAVRIAERGKLKPDNAGPAARCLNDRA